MNAPDKEKFLELIDNIYFTLNFFDLVHFDGIKGSKKEKPYVETYSDIVWAVARTARNNAKYARSFSIFAENTNCKNINNLTFFPLRCNYTLNRQAISGDKIIDQDKLFEPNFKLKGNFDNYIVSSILSLKGIKKVIGEVKNLPNDNLKWKAYRLNNDFENIYFHFYDLDVWIAARCVSITEETKVYVFLSNSYVSVVDTDIFRYSYGNRFDGLESYNIIVNETPNLISDDDLFSLDKNEDIIKSAIEYFKESQEDPFICSSSELEGEELTFISGSEDELKNLFSLVCRAGIPLQAWQEASDYGKLSISVKSSTDSGENAFVATDQMQWDETSWVTITKKLPDDFLDELISMLDVCLDLNTPSGHSWEYNDGSYDRESGYDKTAHIITIDIEAPTSAHDRMAAMVELSKLENKFGKNKIEMFLKASNDICR